MTTSTKTPIARTVEYDWNGGILERVAPIMATAPASVIAEWNRAVEHRERTDRLRERREDLFAAHRSAQVAAQSAVENAEPAAELLKSETEAREELARAEDALSRAAYAEQDFIDVLCNAVTMLKPAERAAWGRRIKQEHIDPRASGLLEAITAVLPKVEDHARAWGLLAWVLSPAFGSAVRVNGPFPTVNGLDVERSSRTLLQVAAEIEGGEAADAMLEFLDSGQVDAEPELTPEQRRANFGRKGDE